MLLRCSSSNIGLENFVSKFDIVLFETFAISDCHVMAVHLIVVADEAAAETR